MTDTNGTFDEPVNPALPDGGPRDGTEQSDDAPGDQVPGEHNASAAEGFDGDDAYEATPRDV
ncbi:hypothetical protein EYE40_11320 [Glaciihabitans arcticus]|uniref:Uncharacterized protein n=1 Tax=Glaciihabitans arcticus TaxID=2668039 RepID=A0A4V2JF39_9MICO|nr:hypothetical protein [Glaciihabitans arcticus]TBN57939.1 hypothetical protein EYE40_11320 [Glaciihabitans arcticus]